MRKVTYLILIILSIPVVSKSQTTIEATKQPFDSLNKIYTTVDQEAKFSGEKDGWVKYLKKNLKADIPVRNSAPDGNYKVIVKFIVSKDGSLSDIHAETKLGYGMEDEVIRILKKSPNWEPATLNGNKVNSIKSLPVSFIVSSN